MKAITRRGVLGGLVGCIAGLCVPKNAKCVGDDAYGPSPDECPPPLDRPFGEIRGRTIRTREIWRSREGSICDKVRVINTNPGEMPVEYIRADSPVDDILEEYGAEHVYAVRIDTWYRNGQHIDDTWTLSNGNTVVDQSRTTRFIPERFGVSCGCGVTVNGDERTPELCVTWSDGAEEVAFGRESCADLLTRAKVDHTLPPMADWPVCRKAVS